MGGKGGLREANQGRCEKKWWRQRGGWEENRRERWAVSEKKVRGEEEDSG